MRCYCQVDYPSIHRLPGVQSRFVSANSLDTTKRAREGITKKSFYQCLEFAVPTYSPHCRPQPWSYFHNSTLLQPREPQHNDTPFDGVTLVQTFPHPLYNIPRPYTSIRPTNLHTPYKLQSVSSSFLAPDCC